MKTTSFILAALLFSTGVILSQNSNTPVTVRIKKVENINGVQKTLDTAYTINDLASLPDLGQDIHIMQIEKDGLQKNMEIKVEDLEISDVSDMEAERISQELENSLVEGNSSTKTNRKVIVIEANEYNQGESTERTNPEKLTKVIVITKINVSEINDEDLKLLGKGNTTENQKLELEQLSVYPNPVSGAFQLCLTLAKKGATTLVVHNGSGQPVYEENLGDFTGTYKKNIDISANPKGIYFVTVTQNKASITKKIILE